MKRVTGLVLLALLALASPAAAAPALVTLGTFTQPTSATASRDDPRRVYVTERAGRVRVIVDGEVRFETQGDYSGIESAPSVGPCFGSTVSIREFSVTPLA